MKRSVNTISGRSFPLDCSQTGFSFQISQPVEAGQPIMLQLSRGDRYRASIMGKAKWISREGSDYRVGCEVSEICREASHASLQDELPPVFPVARKLRSLKWPLLGAALAVSAVVGWIFLGNFVSVGRASVKIRSTLDSFRVDRVCNSVRAIRRAM